MKNVKLSRSKLLLFMERRQPFSQMIYFQGGANPKRADCVIVPQSAPVNKNYFADNKTHALSRHAKGRIARTRSAVLAKTSGVRD